MEDGGSEINYSNGLLEAVCERLVGLRLGLLHVVLLQLGVQSDLTDVETLPGVLPRMDRGGREAREKWLAIRGELKDY